MATQKPKKTTTKKSSTKPETKKEVVATPVTQTQTASAEPSLKGFFARKCDKNENILTIFKTPRIWGALIGELVGTMLIVMLLLTLGANPSYLLFAIVGVYLAVVALSGANLNPLVTVGMMATRRMSAIRGVLYILAQLLGAGIAKAVVSAFLNASGNIDQYTLPAMAEISGETFWTVALVELMGAIIIAFCFARALRFVKKSPLAFAMTVASSITLAVILGIVISNFFGLQDNFIFNPAAALMYGILPSVADGIGELAAMAGLALAAYVVVPMIGGVIGFYLSDFAGKLAANGYHCDDYDCE